MTDFCLKWISTVTGQVSLMPQTAVKSFKQGDKNKQQIKGELSLMEIGLP